VLEEKRGLARYGRMSYAADHPGVDCEGDKNSHRAMSLYDKTIEIVLILLLWVEIKEK